MTVKISLDRPALEALFPEGSEARAHLTRAVVADLVGKLAIKDVKHLDEVMVERAQELGRKFVAELGVRERWNQTIDLSESAVATIRANVQRSYDHLVNDAVRQAIFGSDRKEIERHTKQALDIFLKGEVRAHLKALVAEVLAEKLR